MQERARDAVVAVRRNLGRSLFAAAPATSRRLGRGAAAGLVVAFLVLATIAQLLRIGVGTALDSIWAEDGPVFLQGAMQSGLWHDVTQTYAGYLVVVPRLIGEVGNLVPLRDAAAAIAIASAVVVALSGLAVWVGSAGLIRSPWLRGTLVVVTVLAPTASLESVASGAYVLWYMCFATFWLLIWRPRTDVGAVLGAIFILLTALSTPEVWFLAPLAALRLLALRDRRDGLLVGAWILGSAIQIPAYVSSNEPQVQPLWSHDIWTAFLQRVLDGAALGEAAGGTAWDHLGWAWLIFLAVFLLVALAVALPRAGTAARWLAPLAIGIGFLMFVVSVYQRAVAPEMTWPAHTHFGDGGRYTIVPALLLVSLALVLVERLEVRWRALAPWLGVAAAAILIAGVVASFDVSNDAGRGTPRWGAALDGAREECSGSTATAALVPISPPPFALSVACEDLD
jgi:hypothetical protein